MFARTVALTSLALAGGFPSARAAEPGRTEAAASCAAFERVGPHRYRVQRDALTSLFWAPAEATLATRSARIVPEFRDGRVVGFRLYSVRSDGPFACAGLLNGDILRRVNGRSIDTPESTLAAYAKLKSARRVVMAIERDGRPLAITYDVARSSKQAGQR